jgi:hypothetical protein
MARTCKMLERVYWKVFSVRAYGCPTSGIPNPGTSERLNLLSEPRNPKLGTGNSERELDPPNLETRNCFPTSPPTSDPLTTNHYSMRPASLTLGGIPLSNLFRSRIAWDTGWSFVIKTSLIRFAQ